MMAWLQSAAHHWLASPWSVWGKLPAHGDFLRLHTTPAQARDWQDWAQRVWASRSSPARNATRSSSPGPKKRSAEPGWMQLTPPPASAEGANVPVAFVLTPGSLPCAPRHFVQGVAIASQDQIGRECPLVFFQIVHPRFMRPLWRDRSALPHNALYWLARIAARVHNAEKSWAETAQAVQALDALYSPSWTTLLSPEAPTPQPQELQQMLQRFCADEYADAAYGLRGVKQLPWPGWPDRLLRGGPPAQAFWQQDLAGGYVNASEHLRTLHNHRGA